MNKALLQCVSAVVFPLFVSASDSTFSSLCAMPERECRDLQTYVEEFPYSQYSIYRNKNGSFFVDNINDYIKSFIRRGEPWEEYIFNFIQKYAKKGTCVVDIGAHIGTHVIPMSEQVGPNGTVICFEPQKKIYRELIMNLILNGCSNVMSYRYAIGETEKVVHMCAAVPGNEGGTPIGMGGDEVMMKTLDSFKLENVSLLKIDVEGYEDYVLLGAKETIMRNRSVILIELMGGNDYDTSSPEIRERVDATKNILRSYNYSVSKVFSADYLAIPL